MFLNLSKGQEEVKDLLTRGMVLGNLGGIRNDQLEGLQIDLATMKIQMMGQLVGQMALIQNLAQGHEELKVLINKLHQDGCNQMGQTTKVEDQVTIHSPLRQEVKGKSPQFASGSQAQQQPHQHQQGNWRRQNTSEEHFTEINMPLSQVLHRLLELQLIVLKDPPSASQHNRSRV